MTPAQNTTAYIQGYEDGEKFTKTNIWHLLKELRPAIKPLEGMGKGKTPHEWFDILVAAIEEKI